MLYFIEVNEKMDSLAWDNGWQRARPLGLGMRGFCRLRRSGLQGRTTSSEPSLGSSANLIISAMLRPEWFSYQITMGIEKKRKFSSGFQQKKLTKGCR